MIPVNLLTPAEQRAHRRDCLTAAAGIAVFMAGFWGGLALIVWTGDWRVFGAVMALLVALMSYVRATRRVPVPPAPPMSAPHRPEPGAGLQSGRRRLGWPRRRGGGTR